MDTNMISNESNSHEVELEDNEIINDFTNSKKDENVEVEKLKNDTAPENLVTESTEANNMTKSSKKSLLNQGSSHKTYRQKGSQSKTCINCGNKYGHNKKYARSVTSKCSSKLSAPSTSRSKCSQLSKKYSDRSLVPCQSFDQCSKCNHVIFDTNPSCASFDFCKMCKKSGDNNSHKSCWSQSREMKVRSVTFSTCNDNVNANTSEKSSFCGCNSTLKCNEPCNKESQSCADGNRSVSNINLGPPKEPSTISMMKKMLQERIDACSDVQIKSDKKESKDIKNKSLSARRRYNVKKINRNNEDLECPSNPCCISDERKERMEVVTNKLVQREVVRQKKIQEKREERLKRQNEKNQCEDADKCKMEGKCPEEETSNTCKEYCKKYKKIRYEIELQNYLIDKLNRELHTKISKNYPESTLEELRENMEKEINKLKGMIEATIFEQCKNNNLGWGPIPISLLTSNMISKRQPSCGLPKSPSCLSNVTAFSMHEDLQLCQEKEKQKIQIQLQNNRKKLIRKMQHEIEVLESEITKLKSVQLQLLNGIGGLHKKKSNQKKKTKFVANTKSQVEQIKKFIDKANDDVDKIHVGIHLIRNN